MSNQLIKPREKHPLAAIEVRKVLFGILLIHFILMNIAYQLLAIYFEFPEVLRYPIKEMLARYTNHQAIIQPTYYLFTLTGITFFMVAFLLYESMTSKTAIGRLAMSFGCIAGLLTSFGFIRWVFVMPVIAQSYLAADTSAVVQVALAADMSLIHTYAGLALGENLAFLLQGLWLILLSIDLMVHQKADKALSWLGACIGLGIAVYSLEQFGGMFSWLGQFNIALQAGWLVWLFALSTALLNSTRTGMVALSRKAAAGFLVGYLLLMAIV